MSGYTMSEFNLNSCYFSKPKIDDTGSTKSRLTYKERVIDEKGSTQLIETDRIILQTPKIRVRSCSDKLIEFSLSRNKDAHRELYHKISHLENVAIDQMIDHSLDWFNIRDPMTRLQVESMFLRLMTSPLDIDGPFIFRLPKSDEMIIESNSTVKCLIKVDGLIFSRSLVKLDLRVVKIEVCQPETKITANGSFKNLKQHFDHGEKFYNDAMSIAAPIRPRQDDQHSVQRSIKQFTEAQSANGERSANEELKSIKQSVHDANSDIKSIRQSVKESQSISNDLVDQIVDHNSVQKSTQNDDQVVDPNVKEIMVEGFIHKDPKEQAREDKVIAKIKTELLKAIVENNYSKIKELSAKLNEF